MLVYRCANLALCISLYTCSTFMWVCHTMVVAGHLFTSLLPRVITSREVRWQHGMVRGWKQDAGVEACRRDGALYLTSQPPTFLNPLPPLCLRHGPALRPPRIIPAVLLAIRCAIFHIAINALSTNTNMLTQPQSSQSKTYFNRQENMQSNNGDDPGLRQRERES